MSFLPRADKKHGFHMASSMVSPAGCASVSCSLWWSLPLLTESSKLVFHWQHFSSLSFRSHIPVILQTVLYFFSIAFGQLKATLIYWLTTSIYLIASSSGGQQSDTGFLAKIKASAELCFFLEALGESVLLFFPAFSTSGPFKANSGLK
jgi:hypothetical protein